MYLISIGAAADEKGLVDRRIGEIDSSYRLYTIPKSLIVYVMSMTVVDSSDISTATFSLKKPL